MSTQAKDPLLQHQLATNQESQLQRPNGMQGAMLEKGMQFEQKRLTKSSQLKIVRIWTPDPLGCMAWSALRRPWTPQTCWTNF